MTKKQLNQIFGETKKVQKGGCAFCGSRKGILHTCKGGN